ncbi:ATP-dependent nuclease [Psychromonas sp. L1A2]|uniref:ATP-dependent nuclease n=1 Tax=Psychromonas sp. L1A2 TaxID=2686356 RepID=UPI00135CD709|nr:AAA family ATPase [Psychromonas sp. L1A2]
MHISKLSLINYRNFLSAKLIFKQGINTLIGENGTGKTNIFRAIRLLLDNELPRAATRLNESDFCRQLGDWRGHWIMISLEFDDIAEDEVSQALFLHGTGVIEGNSVNKATYNFIFRPKANIRNALSQLTVGDVTGLEALRNVITIADYEPMFTGKSNADFNDPLVYRQIVGDFDSVDFPALIDNSLIGAKLPNILSISDEVAFTFVKALRDVVSDFRNSRTNPLHKLLKLKSESINQAEFDPIIQLVEDLNTSIETLSDVKEIKSNIKETINDALGDTYSPSSIAIKSDLSDEAEELFQSLKLFVDESNDGYEGSIYEMSLGGANLIFLTLKLLEFKYQRPNDTIANFLLIEEPEAHVHTHIQKSLFDKVNYANTQIIYSTHSSHISEVSNINRVNVISKTNNGCVAYQPSNGLSPQKISFIERYLDAIRSNLLFAKSVILVEGDAEEILIPVLIKKVLGISLDELGITLVNMRSTGFENIALLFHDDRIRKKCAVITDLDSKFFDTTIQPEDNSATKKKKNKAQGSHDKGAARKITLDAFCNGNEWLSPFYAEHTFEVDFVKSGNSNCLIDILKDVYSQEATVTASRTDLLSTIDKFGSRALTMANHQGKGWFAITLSGAINFNVQLPAYIIDALIFSHGSFNRSIIEKIMEFRLQQLKTFIENGRAYLQALNLPQDQSTYDQWNAYLTPIEQGVNLFEPKYITCKAFGGVLSALKADMLADIPLKSNSFVEKL